MICHQDENVLIRDLEERDAETFLQGVPAQGWHENMEKYLRRLRDQRAGRCIALMAQWQGEAAGYVNVYPRRQRRMVPRPRARAV